MTTHFQPDQDESLLRTHAARRMFLSGVYTLVVFTMGTGILYGLGYQEGMKWTLFDGIADSQRVQQLRALSGDPTPTIMPQSVS